MKRLNENVQNRKKKVISTLKKSKEHFQGNVKKIKGAISRNTRNITRKGRDRGDRGDRGDRANRGDRGDKVVDEDEEGGGEEEEEDDEQRLFPRGGYFSLGKWIARERLLRLTLLASQPPTTHVSGTCSACQKSHAKQVEQLSTMVSHCRPLSDSNVWWFKYLLPTIFFLFLTPPPLPLLVQ